MPRIQNTSILGDDVILDLYPAVWHLDDIDDGN